MKKLQFLSTITLSHECIAIIYIAFLPLIKLQLMELCEKNLIYAHNSHSYALFFMLTNNLLLLFY